jgi:hypothetical protein
MTYFIFLAVVILSIAAQIWLATRPDPLIARYRYSTMSIYIASLPLWAVTVGLLLFPGNLSLKPCLTALPTVFLFFFLQQWQLSCALKDREKSSLK